MAALLHFGNSVRSRSHNECFQLALFVSGEVCISSPVLVPVVVFTILVGHGTGQCRLLSIVMTRWLKVP